MPIKKPTKVPKTPINEPTIIKILIIEYLDIPIVLNIDMLLSLSLTSITIELTTLNTATKIIMNEVDSSLEVYCVVSAVAKTGVEMEAIMGVNAALITIYDLSKIVNPHLKIDNVKLLIKEGGKSGLWTNPDGLPEFLKNIF